MPLIIAVLLVLGISVFWNPSSGAMDYFEVPKRALLGCLPLLVLLGYGIGEVKDKSSRWLGWLVALWSVWLVFLACWHPIYDAEVLQSWLLPGLMLVTGMYMPGQVKKWMLAGLLAAGLLQLVVMLGQGAGFSFFDAQLQDSAALIGTIGYHNHAASFMCLMAGLCWFYPWNVRAGQRMLIWGTGCLMVVLALATGCRGTATALAAGVMAVFALRIGYRRINRKYLAAGALLFVLMLLSGSLVWHRMSAFAWDDPRFGLNSRLIMWKAARHLFLAHPWIGNGPGGFANGYMMALADILPQTKTHPLLQSLVFAREPHNDYLFLLTDTGVVGALLVTGMLGLYIRMLMRKLSDSGCPCSVGIYTLVFMGIHAFVSFPWHYPVSGAMAGLLLGMSINDRRDSDEPLGWPRSLCGAHLVVALVVAFLGVMNLWNHYFLFRNDPFLCRNRFLTPRMQALQDVRLVVEGRDDKMDRLKQTWKHYRDPMFCNNLGSLYADRQQWQDAEQVYLFWNASGLMYSQALHNAAVAAEQLEQYDTADQRWQEMVRLWRDADWSVAARRVDLFMKQQKLVQLTAFSQSYINQPWVDDAQTRKNQIHIMNFAAAAYIMQGHPDMARPLLQSILDIEPANRMARENAIRAESAEK